MTTPLHRVRGGAVLVAAAVSLASCAASGGHSKIEPEAFSSNNTHSRSVETAPAFTCEAARRALLSQGFLINVAESAYVKGRKHFQPGVDVHVEIEFNIVCAPDGRSGKKTIAFVTALQDRYALKKSSNSASVGVGPLGSLSVPFSSSDEALVKVASETITSAPFYDRFFALLQRYLAADSPADEPKGEVPIVIVPQAPSVPAAASAPSAPSPPSPPSSGASASAG